MRLTLDVTPTLLRSAGVKNHLFYWTAALERVRGSHSIDYYPFLRKLDALHHDRGRESGIPDWRLFLVAAMNWPPTHALAESVVPRAEVFHGSPQLRLPPRAHRLTSHIHDLTCWRMPELHTRANVNAAWQMADHVWRKADGLIAVSESAKRDAIELLGLDERRIEVIYHGVPESYFQVPRSSSPLSRPYVLHVGTVEPRKNIDLLLDAWTALPQDILDEFELRVAGPAGWQSEKTLARLQSNLPSVRYLGYVPEADLPELTRGATALAYPSLYEGFGFPIAQAMACGAPVVTSNVSSMPEIAGDAALLVDPRSQEDLRDALARILTLPSLRAELGAKGRARAELLFRWDKVARQSWDFFERVAS